MRRVRRCAQFISLPKSKHRACTLCTVHTLGTGCTFRLHGVYRVTQPHRGRAAGQPRMGAGQPHRSRAAGQPHRGRAHRGRAHRSRAAGQPHRGRATGQESSGQVEAELRPEHRSPGLRGHQSTKAWGWEGIESIKAWG